MRVYSRPFSIEFFHKKTTYLDLQDNESLIYIYCPGQANYKISKDDVLFSEKPARKVDSNIISGGDHWIPVFSELGRTVEIDIETFDYAIEDKLSFIIATEDELKSLPKGANTQWMVGVDDFGKSLATPSPVLLFKNKYDFPVWIVALFNFGAAAESIEYELYIDNERILDFKCEMPNFKAFDKPIPVYQWLLPNSRLLWVLKDSPGYLFCDIEILLSKIPITLPYDQIFNTLDPLGVVDEHDSINIIQHPIPVPPLEFPEPPLPDEPDAPSPTPQPPSPPPEPPGPIPPYPPPPDSERDIFAPVPPNIDPHVTTTQKPPDIPEPMKIVRPDETPVVQPMPSPYGGVRPTADIRGRQRITHVAVSYAADKIQVTDTSERTLFKSDSVKTISFYAKRGNWKIKILTIYNQMIGRTISDMDSIYLDEGQAIEMDIEAVQVNAACENATTERPGILYWEAEL